MKKIIIIGATSGIGLEVARCYLKDGWQVGVAGRREEELEKIRLSATGQVCTQTIDVTREDAPFSLEQLITKMGGMDVFLLSSGIGKQNLSLQPDIELQTAATNVSGFIRMVNAAYHYFEQRGLHSRHQRAGIRPSLFSYQAVSEHVHKCIGAIGTHEETKHLLHRYPSRICRHSFAER